MTSSSSSPGTSDLPREQPGPSRRTLIAGAAWSVPAITLVSSSPAFAGSGASSLALTTPSMQTISAGTTPATAVVTGTGNKPVPGAPVSFTGPTGTSFSPASTTADGSGTATSTLTTTDDWATPGSTLTITAVSGGASTSAGLTVLGANAYGFAKRDNGQVNRGGTFYGTGAAGTGTDARTVNPPTQLLKQFPSPIASVAVGKSFSLALLKNGTVWSVGRNESGQLGDGTTTDRLTWAQIPGLTGVTQIVCGFSTGYALRSDGRILAWGYNNSGQLGDGGTTNRSTPALVSGITTATQVVAGSGSAAALLADFTVRTWGSSYYGQLGNGSRDNSGTPVTAMGVTNIAQLAANGETVYALTKTGRIRSWGYGQYGQLGDGTTTFMALSAVDVLNVSNAVQVSGGESRGHAVLSTGQAVSWGTGYGYRLGDGTNVDRSSPVPISSLTGVSRVIGGYYNSFALLDDGSIRWWGYDSQSGPTTFSGTTGVTRIDTSAMGDPVFFIR
ncbi:RCC1 domain-containing protein [Microbacterium proteolyticum]|uniref:RCC1 domain-containing protein n=1 Tax=Microbacterium proteolyticum TaxID=1572644 RepID=UPI001FAD6111|nr:hypothetical protein [Microbacterium proteolyticum]MCI9858971.1 hypothetical protein [Microbacterium proteolyticum]